MTVGRVATTFLLLAIVVSFLAQLAIDFSTDNVACACLILASSLVAIGYVVVGGALKRRPLSAFVILGFCITTQAGAMIAQSAALTPLVSSLYDPLYTFGTLALYQAVAILVHGTMTLFAAPSAERPSVLRRMLSALQLYETPRVGALWIMGAMGLASFPLSNGDGVQNKIASAFEFLTWAPFLIPVYAVQNRAYCNRLRMLPLLVLYAALVALIGIAANYRAAIFIGAVTIALLYFLEALRGDVPTNWTAVSKFIAVLGVAALCAGPVSDLATAMAIARVSRGKTSQMTMLENTAFVYGQKQLISAYRAQEKAATRSSYDEHYIDNPMVARFVQTKFHDNALHFARLLSEDGKNRLEDFTIDTFWTVLPAPLLQEMDVNVNKANLRFSTGDYLAYLSRGLPLGGYRTGSLFAQGYGLFGVFFPFVYMPLCWILFGILDLLTVMRRNQVATLSALGMMEIWPFFWYGISGDGLYNRFVFIVRDFGQMVLIYCLAWTVTRLLLPSARGNSPALDAGALPQ